MPFVSLPHSPLAGGPTRIHYREHGSGTPLVFLHSGWGYEIFPINRVLPALGQYRVLIPDRSGYGRSTHSAVMTPDFHRRAAEETFLFLDALGIERAMLWGHSDGSVIATWMALQLPNRCAGLVLEAFHYSRRKATSQDFFRDMVERPECWGERVSQTLAADHGADFWREMLHAEGNVWLALHQLAHTAGEDLYDGRLGHLNNAELSNAQLHSAESSNADFITKVALLHGADDPRTDPGELDAFRRSLPSAQVRLIANGEHCPHNESRSVEVFTRLLLGALQWFAGDAKSF